MPWRGSTGRCGTVAPARAIPSSRGEFLNALEESGSVGAEAGWLPQHAVLEDTAGAVLGVAPMYLKNHSQGEYVFDWGWADAYERAGGRYYPKLIVAVPFTPGDRAAPAGAAGAAPGRPCSAP